MEKEQHRLRRYVGPCSEAINDTELNEVEILIDFDAYLDYEYSGHFIFTKDSAEIGEAVCNMCCGIIEKDITLSNGEVIYFAFDYGH